MPYLLAGSLCFLIGITSAYAKSEIPIYAAYVSDELASECQDSKRAKCQLNTFDGDALSSLASALPSSLLIEDALSVSEYEVLIGNGIVNIDQDTQKGELVLEITTSWRQVPIDDFNLRLPTSLKHADETAKTILSQWAEHIEKNYILEAEKIYQVLGASDYDSELQVPDSIGDFVKLQSAIYRDPLLGSITRYTHPRFDTAVVDISVYPFSPFLTSKLADVESDSPLQLEMANELNQIKQLITQANINDFKISSISEAVINVNNVKIEGLRLEVLMHSDTDPIYSTQYLFQQNDKIIKLTGNLPEFMMNALVTESLPKIKVPSESSFMRSLRAG